MRRRVLALGSACLVLLGGCLAGRKRAPAGAPGSTLVAANIGAWFETRDNASGVAEQITVGRAIRPHVLVGGRVTGLAELNINLFGEPKDNTAHLVDLGPTIGVATSWSRLSVSAAAGPMLTHVKHHDDGAWRSAWTIGLGADVGIAVRIAGAVGLGAFVMQNLNRRESATGFGLRLEGSVY